MIGWILLGLTAFLKHQDQNQVAGWGVSQPFKDPLPRTSADVLPGDDAGRDPQDPYTGYTAWASSRIPPGGFARQDTEILLNPNQTGVIVSRPLEPRETYLSGRRL